jgi:hypothetical protein
MATGPLTPEIALADVAHPVEDASLHVESAK